MAKTTIVIFGGTGDLAQRKLIPALYNLRRKRRVNDEVNVVGFARALHDRTFKECEVFGMHARSHLDTDELATYGHTTELVMFHVFSILVGARTTKELIVQAWQDEQAMKVRWFSELVGLAANSAGSAVALRVLAPKAQRERSRFVWKVWVWVVGLMAMLFICGIIGSSF